MDLLEHQGKKFFSSHGLPVPPSEVADTPQLAFEVAERLGCPVVVKAQVHIGGRGKAGGIQVADTPEQAQSHATKILGMDIRGHEVKSLLIEKASDIAEEYYASFTLDRSRRKHLGMLSRQGGVDIEDVAENNPEAISRIWIDPTDGLSAEQCQTWVANAKLNPAAVKGTEELLAKLYSAYVAGDADLVEINPLILTKDGKVLALDAKVTLDTNSTFRHEGYSQYDSTQPRDAREQAAHSRGLQYVGLSGSVGVIANGAGLAMSTVDVVNQVGGSPANFLDIGGGADADVMTGALEVINNDPSVKAILINIFGGITRGEEVAKGVIEALARVEIASPIVIRLDGTNAAEGLELLKPHESDRLIVSPTMLDAARLAAELAN